MVKTDPRKARLQVVPQEVDQLARLFRNRVAVEDRRRGHDEGEDEHASEITSNDTNMEVASGSARPESEVASVDGRPFRPGRLLRAVGFEIDLAGSQTSDMPFLRPLCESQVHRKKKMATIKIRTTTMMKREKRFVYARRVRLDPHVLEQLMYLARKELMIKISRMAPEFTQLLEDWDVVHPDKVDWKATKTWLDEHLEVVDRMHLTPRAVGAIATYYGREREPPSIDMLKVMSLKRSLHLDSNIEHDVIKEISAFVFPEDYALPCATI